MFEWKTFPYFFVKSHEPNFSIVIEMVQSTHIQYITQYFTKFSNYMNHLKIYMHFAISCYIYIFSQINYLILIKICSFLWWLHYLAIELPHIEYNLWKSLLILAWWKLKVVVVLKSNICELFLASIMCFHFMHSFMLLVKMR